MPTRELRYAILPESDAAYAGKYGLLWGDERNAALNDKRSPGMADHDKVLYSHAWRRQPGWHTIWATLRLATLPRRCSTR